MTLAYLQSCPPFCNRDESIRRLRSLLDQCASADLVVLPELCSSGYNFANRGQGIVCHNNAYMAALFIPVVAMIPALVISFSFPLLGLFLALVGLMVFRMFVVFPKVACVHCRAKRECPNAQAMGIS